jgi:transposase
LGLEDGRRYSFLACLLCAYQDNADHNAVVNISARNEPLDTNVSGVALCVVWESPPFRAGRFNAIAL